MSERALVTPVLRLVIGDPLVGLAVEVLVEVVLLEVLVFHLVVVGLVVARPPRAPRRPARRRCQPGPAL